MALISLGIQARSEKKPQMDHPMVTICRYSSFFQIEAWMPSESSISPLVDG